MHPSLSKQSRRHENECYTREAASSPTWLERGQKRREMIPKSRLDLYWTREVLVLTKWKLQDPSLKGAISMVLGGGGGGGPAILSSECCIILIFKKEHNNYTFRSICTWLGPHPHRTAVLRVASPAGPGQSSLLPPWPVCGCAAPWLTWASRFQLFSDSSGA